MAYIDRDKFYNDMLKRFGGVPMLTDHSSSLRHDIHLDEALDMQPAADVVEVVRCKDCKYGEHCYPCKAKEEEALEGWYCNIFRGWRSPDDYCSYGKQKPNLSTIPTGSE